ncbi:MAG TPA: hypothetical protein VF622_19785 [Segetibacter sp.]|jgi:hypothetical protein
MAHLKYDEQLQKLFANVNDWLRFAEAKNFGLLSLNAAIVFGFTQTNFAEGSSIAKAGFYVFTPFAVISFFITLISLIPILSEIERTSRVKEWITKISALFGRERKFENIHYYGYLKDIDVAEFENKFLSKSGSTDPFTLFESELGTQILYNSRITWLKYQLFKIAASLFLLGFLAFLISVPIFENTKCDTVC